MARRQYGSGIGKLVAGIVLLVVAAIGLAYGLLLRGMGQAAEDYSRGDIESALQRYENIEHRLRSAHAIRFIPARDRQNLFLNEARLLYAQGRYDDAVERMERENEITGTTSDSRFPALRAEITFRKAVKNFRESAKKDPRVLEESLRAAEDSLKESLRLAPGDWDAKFNFEFINYVRNLANKDNKGQMNILMENVRIQQMKPKPLPPGQQS